ncbi:MAG: transcription antitermination factor NusB [Ruminococcaceae bacterium]|nr:transcription antitermination factor NusB [Oscillospiraceae bacterium]
MLILLYNNLEWIFMQFWIFWIPNTKQTGKEKKTVMAEMTRKEAREAVFQLLFETEFRADEDPREIYAISEENRELCANEYLKESYFGVLEHREAIDEMIVRHSNGWKPSRISPVSRCVIRLCIYEMCYREDIPRAVSLNEAVELVKKYDEEKMRPFVNGLLNGVKNELEAAGKA